MQSRNEKTARKGLACKAARTGQPKCDRKNKTVGTELPGQDCQDRAAKVIQPGQGKRRGQQKRTARKGQLE
jgi:hypothetical protein